MVQAANSRKSGVVFIKKRLYYYGNTPARIIKPSKKESEIPNGAAFMSSIKKQLIAKNPTSHKLAPGGSFAISVV